MEERNNRRVKLLADFFIDIFGALIPGMLFLFSMLLGLVVPGMGMIADSEFLYRLYYIHLDGWFWIVSFLVVLLLGYVIGHIFYRLDINDVDKRSFDLQKKKCIRSQEKEFAYWCKNKKEDWAEADRLHRAKLYSIYFVIRGISEKHPNPCKFRLRIFVRRMPPGKMVAVVFGAVFRGRLFKAALFPFRKAWNEVSRQLLRYFTNRIGMMAAEMLKGSTRDSETIRNYRKLFGIRNESETDDALSVIRKFNSEKNAESDRAARMTYEEFYAIHKFIFTEMDDSKPLDKKRGGENKAHWVSTIRASLPADSLQVIYDYEKSVVRWLRRRYFLRFDRCDSFTIRIIALYFILYMQTEEACDVNKHCDFPYASYYKYLLRRQRYDLALMVGWNDYVTRSKISLNDYKLRVQVEDPQTYMIMIKNEAHIRMASSASYVYLTMRKVLLCVVVVVAGYTVYRMRSLLCGPEPVAADWVAAFFDGSYMWIVPLLVLLFLRAIYRHVPKFLHYQRVREIFQVLNICNILNSRKEGRQSACGASAAL